MAITGLFLVIASFFFGSIPSGFIITKKTTHVDITKEGSGNIGAANVARVIGLRWGVVTLIADALKGFIPVIICHALWSEAAGMNEALKGLIGLAAVLGHQFPIFHRFKGGKGVATSLGVFLGISPLSCMFSVIAFLIVVSLWRYISLGSLIAAVTMPFWLYLTDHSGPLIMLSSIISLLIIVSHRENIHRLINGNERRWEKKHHSK